MWRNATALRKIGVAILAYVSPIFFVPRVLAWCPGTWLQSPFQTWTWLLDVTTYCTSHSPLFWLDQLVTPGFRLAILGRLHPLFAAGCSSLSNKDAESDISCWPATLIRCYISKNLTHRKLSYSGLQEVCYTCRKLDFPLRSSPFRSWTSVVPDRMGLTSQEPGFPNRTHCLPQGTCLRTAAWYTSRCSYLQPILKSQNYLASALWFYFSVLPANYSAKSWRYGVNSFECARG